MIYFSNFLIYFILLSTILISIIGYGILTSRVFSFHPFFNFNISHYFIIGLIFIGSISVVVNSIYPITDYYTISIITLGIFLFINQHKVIFKNLKKIFFYLFPITILAFLISFYAGLSDD